MHTSIRRPLASALLALAVCSAGCAMNMVEPSDVIQVSEQLPISARSSWSGALVDESFGLGAYKVRDVDRKGTRTSAHALLGFSAKRSVGGYTFALDTGSGKLEGECATESREKSQDLGSGAAMGKLVAKLGCRCAGAGADADAAGAATLTLEASTQEQYEGVLTAPELEYKVSALTQRNKGWASSDPLGYRVDAESGPIGAVELKKPGRVWISRALTGAAREQVACLFAGLLLYQPPKDR